MTGLDDLQREVVGLPPLPVCVRGSFGCGVSSALSARAAELRAGGRKVLELSPPLVELAASINDRAGRHRRVLDDLRQLEIVRALLMREGPAAWPSLGGEADPGDERFAREVSVTLSRYRTSFLGAEELFTHADAAGAFDVWHDLERFRTVYEDELDRAGVTDASGAVVRASLALRDPEVLAIERSRFDDIVVDDFQEADFATMRLLTQLTGPGGSLTVGGNPEGTVSTSRGADPKYLLEFPRRFGAASLVLSRRHRLPEPPVLRIARDSEESGAIVSAASRANPDAQVLTRESAAASTGREWPVVIVSGAEEGVWPLLPRPEHRWFDLDLLRGPDVRQGEERDAAWIDEERRRFLVATTRASRQTVVVAAPPVTRFVDSLIV